MEVHKQTLINYVKFLIQLIKGDTIISPEMMFNIDHMWMTHVLNEIFCDDSKELYSYSAFDNAAGSVVFREWENQSTLIFGCGHHDVHYDQHYHTSDEYLIDIDITILPDMCLKVCHQSLAAALPSAKGKINKIVFEGWLGEETKVFYDDCLFLLADNGVVVTGNDNSPRIIKKNNKLFVVDTNTEYHPWTSEDVSNKTFGCDIHDWKAQCLKNNNLDNNLDNSEMSSDEIIEFISSLMVSIDENINLYV